MREVSCRPVRSEEDTLTGAPRCRRMLTLRSRSIPDAWRGDAGDTDNNATLTTGLQGQRGRVADGTDPCGTWV